MATVGNIVDNSAGRAQRSDGISLGTFLASLTVSIVCLISGVLLFIFLKDRISRVYQPRVGVGEPLSQVDPLPRGPFKWILPIVQTRDEILFETVGIDAFFFLRYLYMLAWTSGLLSIIVIPVLITTNLLQSHGNKEIHGMNRLSWASTQGIGTSHYWANLACAALVSLVCCLTIHHELAYFIHYRQCYMQSPVLDNLHCVLLRDIPGLGSNENAFRSLVDSLSPLETWLDKDLRKSRALREKWTQIRDVVESSETSLIRKAVSCIQSKCADYSRSKRITSSILPQKTFETIHLGASFQLKFPPVSYGKKVDKIQHCMVKLNQIRHDFDELARAPHALRRAAILRFRSRTAAQAASQLIFSASPWYSTSRLLETGADLNNIEWEHLSMHVLERALRRATISGICALLVVSWVIPIACVSSLSQLSLYYEYFEWARWTVKIPSWVLVLLQGVLPQAGCTALMTAFPILLRFLLKRQSLPTRADLELTLQQYYFWFLYLHLFFTVSVSSGLTAVLYRIVEVPRDTPMLLAQNLPKASNFFLSYLLLQAFTTSAMVLSQASVLVLRPVANFFDRTVRQKWERRSSASRINWGTFFPTFTNLGCILIIYSPIAPIILPIGFMTFGCFWTVYRYWFLYVKPRQVQSGGLLYLKALFQLFTGIYTMEICVLGLFLLARDADGSFVCIPHTVIMVCVIVLTITVHRLLHKKFPPLALLTVREVNLPEARIEQKCKKMLMEVALQPLQDVWLPRDEFGICTNEMIWLKEIAPDVPVTSSYAAITRDGTLKCSWPVGSTEPPMSQKLDGAGPTEI